MPKVEKTELHDLTRNLRLFIQKKNYCNQEAKSMCAEWITFQPLVNTELIMTLCSI